jgi:SH3 domain protein
MKKFWFTVSIILSLSLMGQISWAAKAYVTDSFRISLRGGPSIDYKILKFLTSGLPVDVLESEEGWTRVQLLEPAQDSITGWVLSRYLITRIPWENQAISLKREKAQLEKRLSLVEKELDKGMIHKQELTEELEKDSKNLRKLQDRYEIIKQGAPDYLNLKATYETAQKTIQTLVKENQRLKSSQMNRWFAMGALVLLCGLMIGLLVGRQQKKRSSYY